LLLALVPAYLTFTGKTAFVAQHFWLLYTFVSGLTFIVVLAVLISGRVSPENFAQTFLAATVFKILASLAFIVVFMVKIPLNKTVFTVDFVYLYFLNTAFEVYILLRNLRNQNLK
jgi:ABC-type methionine transport system permease subunit